METSVEEMSARVDELVNQNNELINANSQYQQILEKTNDQLSLWNNPYGISVGVLTVLFAILTIVATVIIFHLNRSNKKLIREELDNVIGKQRKEALEAIEVLKDKTKEDLKKAGQEQKEKIEKRLANIENKELELKAGFSESSNYMKKEDFLCESCRGDYGGVHSSFMDSICGINSMRGLGYLNAIGRKRKCLACGKEF